jgi:hypothetical protein
VSTTTNERTERRAAYLARCEMQTEIAALEAKSTLTASERSYLSQLKATVSK